MGFNLKVPLPIKNYLPYIFAILFFGFLLLLSPTKFGADFGIYLWIADVFQQGDIFAFPSTILSPLKVPLSQWSFGPGLLFSFGSFFFKKPLHGAWVAGWVFIIIFWWAFIGILYYLSKGNTALTLFGVCIAFIGTPVGFYSIAYSSESFSYACLALMLYWVLTTQKDWATIDFLFVGILAGILIIIRPQLAIYCVPIYGVVLYRTIEKPKKLLSIKACSYFSLSIFPIILSIISVLIVNRWMTGSVFRSPYTFGSESFKSIDWRNPELLAVLIHPWHGLLSHHPVFAIGFISLILLIFHQEKITERLSLLFVMLALLFHFYLQASWYAWWLGSGTFGMRGLSTGAIFLTPALIHFISKNSRNHFLNKILYWIISLSCFWSFLLLMQNIDNFTQFYTYKQLLYGQYKTLMTLFSSKFVLFIILVLIIGFIKWLKERQVDLHQYLITLILVLLMLYYFFDNLNLLRRIFDSSFSLFYLLTGFQIVLTLLIPIFVYEILFIPPYKPYPQKILKKLIPYASILLFCIATFLFTRLVINTEKQIAKGYIPVDRRFDYISSVDINEVEGSYEEYLKVPGFEKKKIALYNYLTLLKEKTKISKDNDL